MVPPAVWTRTSLRVLVLPLVALLVVALPAGSSTATAPVSASAPPSPSAYATQAVEATNRARARNRLPAVRRNQCLQRFAATQARRMAAQRRLFHQDLRPVLRRCRLSSTGENVAYGYTTGRAAVGGWMRSPGHRANILRRGFRVVGIAARRSSDGRWYAAQVFGRRA